MTVRGVMMHRLENHLDRLESDLDQLRAIVAQNIEATTKLTDGMIVMQRAMNNLFEHVDRLIRGLESDGHKGGKKKRPD